MPMELTGFYRRSFPGPPRYIFVLYARDPLWLLRKKKRTEALESLVWLRGTDGDTEEECFNVESTIGTRAFFFFTSMDTY